MTMMTRWMLTVCVMCAYLASASNAESSDRLLKLLQLQTLNRMASDSAPTKKNASSDDSARQDRGADRRGSQTQPDNSGGTNNLPARKR
ncbi:hypothetical protein B0G75_103152 [Paraburkholderia sp. BL18I3N2]|nr:hypothetical protein B0G75_103152 [Paraburkholderia sp. BL18I3N2]